MNDTCSIPVSQTKANLVKLVNDRNAEFVKLMAEIYENETSNKTDDEKDEANTLIGKKFTWIDFVCMAANTSKYGTYRDSIIETPEIMKKWLDDPLTPGEIAAFADAALRESKSKKRNKSGKIVPTAVSRAGLLLAINKFGTSMDETIKKLSAAVDSDRVDIKINYFNSTLDAFNAAAAHYNEVNDVCCDCKINR